MQIGYPFLFLYVECTETEVTTRMPIMLSVLLELKTQHDKLRPLTTTAWAFEELETSKWTLEGEGMV